MEKTKIQYYQLTDRCKELFLLKSKDYGTSWEILRMSSLTDLLYIKAERIRSIEESGVNMVGDSVEGEYIGIVNYCVIALILLEVQEKHEGRFPKLWREETQLRELYEQKIQLAYELMEKKNHDYGEAWRNMRTSSITDMILMRLMRLKQIEDNAGETLVSEGADANYTDMLNYAIFALIQLSENNN